MIEETFEAGMTVSLVARRHGVSPNWMFTWRRPVAQGGVTAAGSGEEIVPASDYRVLQNQVRELHRLLGKKTLEAEIPKEALDLAGGSKTATAAAAVCAEGRLPIKNLSEMIAVSRANLIEHLQERPKRCIGRPSQPGDYGRVSPRPDAATDRYASAIILVHHYNEVHPHEALENRSPHEFTATHETP